MFGRKKKSKIIAPQSGECVALDMVPDPVFAEKILGDGVAIIPTDDEVKAPVSGTVVQIAETLHAYSILSEDGLEVLVHIGLDTVELSGEGFSPKVKVGDKVAAGDILCTADIKFIAEKGYKTHTPVVVANYAELKSFDVLKGQVTGGETAIAEYVR